MKDTDIPDEKRPRNYSESRLSCGSQVSSNELYPGNDDHSYLGRSNDSFGSLWRQYSLINEKYQKKVKQVDLCFCCNTDSFRRGTLKGIFLLVVGIGLLTSFLALRFSVFSPRTVFLTGGDQALLPVSTYFNKQIKVKEQFSKIGYDGAKQSSMLYLLSSIPPISSERVVYTEGTRFMMPSWSYQYWGLNLLNGTELTISVCSDLHLQFYIIKGEKKLKSWKETILFNQYNFQSNIRPKQTCSGVNDMIHHSFKVDKSEVFYVMFSSSVGWRFFTEVNVVFSFNRTVYDTSLNMTNCYISDASCIGSLRYSSEDIVLIESALNATNPTTSFDTISLTYEPLPRWGFYLKLFGFIYLTIILCTLLYTIWRFVVMIRSKRSTMKDEKRPLLKSSSKSYSLRSQQHAKENWLVVKHGSRSNSSDQDDLKINERETQSILDNSIDADHPPLNRRATLNSTHSTDSQESQQFQNRRNAAANERQRLLQQNMDQQQLLDSVMTAAGVSAI